LGTGKLLKTLTSPQTRGGYLTLSPDGKTLAIGSPKGFVEIFDTDTGKPRKLKIKGAKATKGPGSSMVSDLVFSPDGSSLAVGYGNGNLELWDLATQTARTLGRDNRGSVTITRCAFSPDGKFLAAAGKNSSSRC